MKFLGTKTQIRALKQSAKQFCDLNEVSIPQLIELAKLDDVFTGTDNQSNPKHGVKRQSLNKFISETEYKLQSHKIMEALWIFFRDHAPNEFINARASRVSSGDYYIYDALADIYKVDDKETIDGIGQSLTGQYFIFRQPWKSWIPYPEKIVIGHMHITTPDAYAHNTRVVEFQVKTKVKNPVTGVIDKDEFDGYVYLKNDNIVMLGKDIKCNPVFMVFSDMDKSPDSDVKIEWLRGNLFAGIGRYDHKSLRVGLHRTNNLYDLPMNTYDLNNIKLDFFSQDSLLLMNEDKEKHENK